MVGEDDVRAVGYEEVVDGESAATEFVDLIDEGLGIDDDTGADQAGQSGLRMPDGTRCILKTPAGVEIV